MRILIAEDHPDNREMLTRRLERRGYEVHGAENGAEAVEKAKACCARRLMLAVSRSSHSRLTRWRARGASAWKQVAMTSRQSLSISLA